MKVLGPLLPSLALTFAACPLRGHAQSDFVRIQAIDRGQADGMLMRTPNHKSVVLDAGPTKDQTEAMRALRLET